MRLMNRNTVLVFCLFALGLSVRLLYLVKGFYGDEALTLASASAASGSVIPTLIKIDLYPPLTVVLLHLWMRISQSEIFIRSYFILFGLGVLAVLYRIADELSDGDKQLARIVLLLAAVSPMLVSLSQFARGYIDSAFWVLLSDYFLLLILKDKDSLAVWIGYALSALLSMYTFYFAAVIIFSQTAYVLIVRFRQAGLLKKWLVSQGGIALFFLPWLPSMLTQFAHTSKRVMHWERYGFKVAGFDLGIFVRNCASLCGFDHFFMVYPEGIVNHFSRPLLIAMASVSCLGLLLFVWLSVLWLRRAYTENSAVTWFLPALSIGSLLVTWVAAKFLGALPNARYLAALHGIFIVLIAFFVLTLIRKNRVIGVVFLSILIAAYAWRIPAAVAPEFEINKILGYLERNVQSGDCIVLLEPLPGSEKMSAPVFNLENFLLQFNSTATRYDPLPEKEAQKARKLIAGCKRVWFIPSYGNTEIFGGNKIAYDFLKNCGRKEHSSVAFHNIKLVLME